MTTEDDFQTKLDTDILDWQTRLVLGDWLEERGDPRGPGYRALGQLRLFPFKHHLVWDSESGVWTEGVWQWGEIVAGKPYSSGLKSVWFNRLDWPADERNPKLKRGWNTRRAADDAAALAFSLIPPNQLHRAFK